jgi:hypothetical protein
VLAASLAAHAEVIDFEDAPTSFLPSSFYAPLGVTIALTPPNLGPNGLGQVAVVQAPAGAPPPGQGQGLRPYANLAGFLGAFEFTFSTPIDFFSIYAAGPQAFTVQGLFGGQTVAQVNVPFESGRAGTVVPLTGMGLPLDRVVITPTGGVFELDPAAGPGFYDHVLFNHVPAPASALVLAAPLALGRRRRPG